LLSKFIDFKTLKPIDQAWDKESLKSWFEYLQANKAKIKPHLDLKIPDNPDNIVKFAHNLLNLAGLKFTKFRSGNKRSYKLESLTTAYDHILSRWAIRDHEKYKPIKYKTLIDALNQIKLTSQDGVNKLKDLVTSWGLETIKDVIDCLSVEKAIGINKILGFSKNLVKSSTNILRHIKPNNITTSSILRCDATQPTQPTKTKHHLPISNLDVFEDILSFGLEPDDDDFKNVLDKFGLQSILTVISRSCPRINHMSDIGALAYRKVAEYIAKSKLKYVGVSHYIVKMKEHIVTLNTGLECSVFDLVS
jgi:hypothetical protein